MMAALSFNVFSFMFLACTLTSRSEILHQRPHDAASPANRRMSPSRTIADLPDVHMTGIIVIKIKSLSYIRELSYEKNNLTRRLIALCEIEMAKFFKNVKGKQTVKVESFRRGRWSKVIVLMLLHSTGNGDINEISDTVKNNVQIPGRFITYDVDRKMASFRPNGVFCQPRVHYAFESLSASEVYDDSGYDNNGVIYGNVTTTNYGKCGRAAKFKNGYVFLRKFKKTKTSDSDVILIAFWLRMHQPRSTTSLFRGYYKGAVVEIFTQRGLLKWKLITQPEETAFLVRHVKLLKPRTWTHVVAVYDPYALKAKLYIDLELVNEVKVRQGIVHWRFTSSLRFGMTSSEGYLDDLYVYDCLLSENVLNGIRKDCWCEELCAPRGKNEFLVRMLLTFNSSFNSSAQRLANRVRDGITNLFTEVSGEQRVETIGQRPINADSIIVDYSLQSIGNSDTRYLAGVIRPSITSGSIAGVDLASRDVSFIPISGKSVCRSTEMSCGDGDCISKLWMCDGEINCADGRDEVNCGDAVVFDCQSNEFTCNRSRVYGISDCIEARFRCDRQLDCDDDSDEWGCVPPKVITAPRSLIILAKGETARCTCAASGVPYPKVSWYSKGRKILSLPEKISVTSVAGHGQLTIFNVGEKDSGDYICQISNNRVRKTVAPSCTVKVRALGSVCALPFFNSIAQRSDECLRCFCYEKTMTCRSAELYRSKLQSYWDCFSCTKIYEPILVDVFGKQTDVYRQTSSSPLFWRLPKKYSGNKITSYGGRLQFALESDLIQNALRRSRRDVTDESNRNQTVWNYIRERPNKKSWLGISASPRSLNDVPMVHNRSRITRVSQSKALNLSDSHMVYIMGNDGTLLAATQLNSYDGGMYGIDLIEKKWMDTNRQRNIRRSTLLRVLTNVKYIFIKATSSNGYVLRLRKFSLDSAVSKENGGRRVHLVEQCTCPEGYSGYSCEKCSDGYFRRNGGEECLRCSCNGHSSSCDHKTGRCNSCDHNTSGMNCEVCKAGFYGDATVGTPYDCKKCNCPLTVESNSFSETCYLDRDGKSTCNSCFPGYTGRNCEICDSGYEGNPSVVGGTCYSVGNFSKCHSAGSMSQSINSFSKVTCHCKKNVVGTICDKCREGTFNLQTSNPSGCEKCSCSKKSKNCSNLVGLKYTIQGSFANDVFTMATLYSRRVVKHSIHNDNGDKCLRKVFSSSEENKRSLYWHLPSKFAGSKVASYGGYLQYTVTYSWKTTKRPSTAFDVILLGRRFGIKYVGRNLRGIDYVNGKNVTYRVALTEQFWRFSSNSRISKALFVVFLGRIHKLLILATPYVSMLETRLHNVELDSAVESELGTTIPGIERCNCPTGYTGFSCESCAMGYTLSASSFILGSCVKCRCHKHARFCNPLTGECENCQNNTTGKYCERCKPGFYGNARNGSPCEPCPCPRIENIRSTEEETTCSLGDDGEPVCDRCPEGHEGKLCNRCQKGFTGNPKVPGEVCTPVSSCGCSHAGTERCDEQTQTCICKANVHGEKCDECKRGFFNLQSGNKDGCSPCFCMGLNTTCSISTEKPDNIKFTPRHPLPSDLIITTENFSQNTSDYLLDRRIKQVRFMYKSWMAMSNIFWRIPSAFVGNKLQFYGGLLTFFYFYLTTSSKNFEIERFITMKGNGMTLHYKEHTLVPANMNKKIEILLSERYWFKANGHSVSRDEFMRVLINIDSILIPVTYSSKFSESRLGEVTLISANDRTNAGKPEMCDCPDNTIGTSCESCVTGYSRNGEATSFCTPCQCNSHATDCDPTTGVCKDCKNNTDGIHCEICARGFYGNATSGSKIGCKECPCPLAGLSNRFSETCFMDDDGLPTCDACLDGYTGRRCEKCSANYTGNPLTPGGKCFKAPVLQILQMKIIPEILTVQEGDNARFVCNVKSPRPTRVIWSRSESKTLPRASTVYGNVLSFTSLKLSDAGTYWCTASNDISLKTARAQLIVEEQQLTAVIVDVAPKSRYIPVGGTAKFFCTSRTSSRHSITWSREHDKAMPLTSQIKDGSLIITNAQLDDGGTYICTGKNSLNIDRAIISLHVGVVVKPEVTVSPRKQTVDVANTVKFRCSASAGFPAATLHWERKDGRRLPRFSKFFRRTGVFKILAASRRDEGEYRCIARNTGGESTMDVLLLVKGPNSAPTVNMRPVSVTVNEGQTTVLRCDVMGEEPMAITWQKKDGKLPARAIMNRNVLEIKNTSIRERGRYICTAVNKYGKSSAVSSLFVNRDVSSLPEVSIKPSGKVLSVMEGEALYLLCKVSGDEELESVKWSRRSTPSVLSDNVVLKLTKVKVEDTGVYECSVKTKYGQNKAFVSVIVKRKNILPKVQILPSRVFVTAGNNVSLQCKVSSIHPVTVTWSRTDGVPLSENYLINNTVLLIPNVKTKDEATYVCLGENAFGASKATVELTISKG